jgi:4-hydroxy-4-methyl-2-oxoglutarate aldolase
LPLRPKIVRSIKRAPAEAISGLAWAGVATVHESYARTGFMHGIKPVTGSVAIAGSAVTCLNYAGDNLMLLAALDVVEAGDVIVVGVTAPSAHGMFGDVLATACAARGVQAVVLDAGARDVTTLREMGFPVWSRHIGVNGTVKNSPGWVNVPIACGGQIVNPGDVIVADDDGVVVIARDDAVAVAEAAHVRVEKEIVARDEFRSGLRPLDKGDRRAMLAPFEEGAAQ